MKDEKTPTDLGDFLLDIKPSVDGKGLYIYNLTQFLPHVDCDERENRLRFVKHTIKGKDVDVHIIDDWNMLDERKARKLAIQWYTNDLPFTRLDSRNRPK